MTKCLNIAGNITKCLFALLLTNDLVMFAKYVVLLLSDFQFVNSNKLTMQRYTSDVAWIRRTRGTFGVMRDSNPMNSRTVLFYSLFFGSHCLISQSKLKFPQRNL